MSDTMTDREAFLRDNADAVVAELEGKLKRLRSECTRLLASRRGMREENSRLRAALRGIADKEQGMPLGHVRRIAREALGEVDRG